ncbi:hypothetical protein Marpi_0402 [Marinitoga piezophila KA3]|uniref:TOTE conflict system primase domain-containing protein n=1 Tax=Marinitoga piezophila (strain DSM 14283 / JCM 11233 / KA3) TaxID=443254 RepID=H2J4R1_MARPK|nr:CRISPR-associated primase-polymerase type A1 [Marinitoga piezophila]AEX84846.1 hypothetical protein Marpi_0402 [Marinitoga piezophila KA3]
MNFKELAFKAEEDFDFEKAIEYYKKAFNELTINDDSLIRYANLLFDFQKFEEAEPIFEKIVSEINDSEYMSKLAIIYEENNKFEKALKIYKELGIESKVKELSDKIELKAPSQNAIKRFMTLFSGREDVFSIQYEGGYRPIRRPLNFHDIKDHFSGKKTLGIYLLKKNDTVKFAAYDIDIKKHYLNREDKFVYEENSKKVAKRLSRELNLENIIHYFEFTGNRGYHIWIFFDIPVSAYKIKYIMEKILDRIELEEGIDVEIFPKQTSLNGGLGNLIKVPLGVHKKTGKKCLFVDNDFNVIENQIEFLNNIKENKATEIDKLFREIFNENDYDDFNVTYKKRTTSSKNSASKKIKSSIRKTLPKSNKNIFTQMIEGCHILKQINEKIEKEAYITEEEEMIFIKSLANLENSKKFIEMKLSQTINFSKKRIDMIIKQSLGVPITCEEIRKIILNKDISLSLENCTCKFQGNYNSPYAIVENIEEMFLDKIDINDIAKKIVEKNAEKFEIEKEIKNLKRMIAKKMGDSKELRTEIGTIKRFGDDIEIIL